MWEVSSFPPAKRCLPHLVPEEPSFPNFHVHQEQGNPVAGGMKGSGHSVPVQAGAAGAELRPGQRVGRPAVPCARKEAQLPLIVFLLLPPAWMRGNCRFCGVQVTAGDLVVLPRGDPRPEQPQLSPSHGSLPAEPFLAFFLA